MQSTVSKIRNAPIGISLCALRARMIARERSGDLEASRQSANASKLVKDTGLASNSSSGRTLQTGRRHLREPAAFVSPETLCLKALGPDSGRAPVCSITWIILDRNYR